MEGAWICGKEPHLNLTHMDIPYALRFRNCHFTVAVDMQDTECKALYLGGSYMVQGLRADGLTTKGGVYLDRGFSAKKGVYLRSANIGGQLNCIGGKFEDRNSFALNVQKAEIRGGLLWRNKITGSGIINLGYARVSVLSDESDSWEPFQVFLDGFTYDQFARHGDVKSRCAWLEKRPEQLPGWSETLLFSPLPYEQAAKVLFGMGHGSDARKILLEKERRQTADARTPLLRKIGRGLWDIFAGYGYRLRRTLYWMAGFVGLGALLFSCADYYGRMAPHQPVVLAHQDYNVAVGRAEGKNKCPKAKRPTEVVACLFPEYPKFHPLVYSADVFIPFFALHQEPYWYPNPSDADRDLSMRFLLWWYWIEIAAGWLLTSLFLLSVTGLLRPRQSSGGKD